MVDALRAFGVGFVCAQIKLFSDSNRVFEVVGCLCCHSVMCGVAVACRLKCLLGFRGPVAPLYQETATQENF